MKIQIVAPLRKLTVIVSTACVISLVAPHVDAAELTYANNWNYIIPPGASLSGTDYYASTTDLANAGQPTLLGTEWSGGQGHV